MKRLVIVGNGGAAISALRAIRSVSRSCRIALISGEDCPAYSPVLTTYYLAGSIPYRGMFLCRRDFYRRHGVRAILGDPAVAVEPEGQRVLLASGQAVPYDEVLIATGSSVAVPPIPGVEGCLTLWTAQEARQLREQARKADRVAVVGAGLIGIQIVDALLRWGKKVALVEMQDRLLPRVMDGQSAAILKERLQAAGVDIHLSQQVREVRGQGGNKELMLSSGAVVAVGVVVFATGVRPNAGLLAGCG
ncbi:MAG: FAD-dependent oxidoreductase, partial [Chloroflexota bacterium]